jgi:hypothetical protein
MTPEVFTIKNGKAFIDADGPCWIRKDDMLYYLMRIREIWENQLKCYEGQEDLAQFEYTRGKIDVLTFLIKELKGE